MSLCWDDGWPRFYDPATNTYLETWQEAWDTREAERESREAVEAQAGRLAERASPAGRASRTARLPRRASASLRRSYVVGKRTTARAAPTQAEIGGRRPAHGRAASSWPASRNKVASSPKRATKCVPMGRPASFQNSGTDIAGWPVPLLT